jgi:hypothetical protein
MLKIVVPLLMIIFIVNIIMFLSVTNEIKEIDKQMEEEKAKQIKRKKINNIKEVLKGDKDDD